MPQTTIKLKHLSKRAFLIAHGWKKHLGSWWYKPLPGLGGKCSPHNELHCLGSAFEAEHEIQMQEIATQKKLFGG